jgi:hypothetical protein
MQQALGLVAHSRARTCSHQHRADFHVGGGAAMPGGFTSNELLIFTREDLSEYRFKCAFDGCMGSRVKKGIN